MKQYGYSRCMDKEEKWYPEEKEDRYFEKDDDYFDKKENFHIYLRTALFRPWTACNVCLDPDLTV